MTRPIFFAWTRSFWLSVAGILLLVAEVPKEATEAAILFFAKVAAPVLPWSAADIASTMTDLLPALIWLAVLHQRSGAARPYTTDPRAIE